ncbi:hypothetical protein ABPG77_005586 [Micractinium sp. CCAP 211/92]
MVQGLASSGSPRAAAAVPLLARCLAAEAELPRSTGGQLLAAVPGTQLLLAAAGAHLLLLRATPAGVAPVAALLEAQASISALAVSSVTGGDGQQRWVAALAGGTAHLMPLCTAASGGTEGGGAADNDGCSFDAPRTAGAWQAGAWHPSLPVCALAAPGQLLLVSVAGLDGGGQGSNNSSSSCNASPCGMGCLHSPEGQVGGSRSGGSNARVLAALATSAADAGQGRCCLAWLCGSSSMESSNFGAPGLCRSIVLSRGARVELLVFGSGWQLLERRELLAGLHGPVRGLAAAGSHAVLVTTERPVGSWLSPAALSERRKQQQQQQQQQRVSEDLGISIGSLPSPLHLVARSQHQAVRPPGPPTSSTGTSLVTEVHAAGRHADSPPSTAGDEGGLIDLTGRMHSQSGDAPKVPASFLLGESLLVESQRSQMLLGGGLPGLLLPSSPPGQEGGRVTLLWLDRSGSEAAAAGPRDGASGSAAGGTALPLPAGSAPPAAPLTTGQPLGFTPDLLQLLGGLAVLGSSSSAAPALALCTLGQHQAHLLCGAVHLALPEGMPEGSLVRLRGLAVVPATSSKKASDGSGGAAGRASAGAPSAAAGGASWGQAHVWALFAAAAKRSGAQFLGAALDSSTQQQVWLACYSLQQLFGCSGVAAGELLASAGSDLACGTSLGLVSAQQGQDHGRSGLTAFCGTQAGGCSETAAEAALLAVQGEVAALRREVNARLDDIEVQLCQLLQALRKPP